MTAERKICRYTAYFPGWATAFGSHDRHPSPERDLVWLLAENQLGLILSPAVKTFLDPLLSQDAEIVPPPVELDEASFRIADVQVRFGDEDQRELEALRALLDRPGDLHLLQTYHLVYPSGTRILTLTRQAPLALVYREIKPLRLWLN